MRELMKNEIESVDGGIWPIVAGIAAFGAWAWENRADLMEVGDAAAERHAQLNSEH